MRARFHSSARVAQGNLMVARSGGPSPRPEAHATYPLPLRSTGCPTGPTHFSLRYSETTRVISCVKLFFFSDRFFSFGPQSESLSSVDPCVSFGLHVYPSFAAFPERCPSLDGTCGTLHRDATQYGIHCVSRLSNTGKYFLVCFPFRSAHSFHSPPTPHFESF